MTLYDLNALLGPRAKIVAGPVRPRPRKFRAICRVPGDCLPQADIVGTLRCGMSRYEGVRIVKVTTYDPEGSTIGVIVELEQK